MLGVLEWIWRILIWGLIIGSLVGVVVAVFRSRYARQRLVQLVIVVFAVTVLTFSLLRLLPGRPEIAIAGPGAGAEGEGEHGDREHHDHELHQPLPGHTASGRLRRPPERASR